MYKYFNRFGITGEWFNVDPEAVIAQALQTGAGPNVSDAYTINGLPGPLYNCSAQGIMSLTDKYTAAAIQVLKLLHGEVPLILLMKILVSQTILWTFHQNTKTMDSSQGKCQKKYV